MILVSKTPFPVFLSVPDDTPPSGARLARQGCFGDTLEVILTSKCGMFVFLAQETAYWLVGGFNTSETSENILVKIGSFPQGSGWKFHKIFELPPPSCYCFIILRLVCVFESSSSISYIVQKTRGRGLARINSQLEVWGNWKCNNKNHGIPGLQQWKNGWQFGWMFGLLKKNTWVYFCLRFQNFCFRKVYTPKKKTCVLQWYSYSSSYSRWSLISSGTSERRASLKDAVGHGNSCCKQISMRSEHLKWITLYGLCSILTNTITQTYPMFWFKKNIIFNMATPIHCSETLCLFAFAFFDVARLCWLGISRS